MASLLELDYQACKASFPYWLSNWGYIRDERTGVVHGPGIRLWPGQWDYVKLLVALQWVIIGKTRQIGASWLAANYEVWKLLFHDNIAAAVIAQDDTWAMFHLKRAKWIYEQQPEHLRRAVPVTDNMHEVVLSNASSIKAMPCTDKAARGISASLVRCEEFAFWENPEGVWPGIIGAVGDSGGQLVVISTANGEGNKYHELWRTAIAGGNRFQPVFFPWHAHPERDDEWRMRMLRDLGTELTKQEYPASAAEMFIASGSKYFDIERLVLFDASGAQLQDGNTNTALAGYPQGWSIYQSPQEGAHYAMGVDTADTGKDACSADIIDIHTGIQVAHIHSPHWGWDRFADEVYSALLQYNGAYCVPEQNNHGHALIHYLSSVKGYTRLYRYEDYDVVKRTGVQRLGWNNNSKTRPELLGKLKTAIRDLAIKPTHEPTITEMRGFEYNSSMRAEAKAGLHDDRVFSLALANLGRDHELAHTGDNFVMVI